MPIYTEDELQSLKEQDPGHFIKNLIEDLQEARANAWGVDPDHDLERGLALVLGTLLCRQSSMRQISLDDLSKKAVITCDRLRELMTGAKLPDAREARRLDDALGGRPLFLQLLSQLVVTKPQEDTPCAL